MDRLRQIIINEGNKWRDYHTDPEKKAYWQAFADQANRYDWKSLPDWMNFVAIDENGKAYGYDIEPYTDCGAWHGSGKCYCTTGTLEAGEDWTQTLEERPNEQ
jgi:hypothetical protein